MENMPVIQVFALGGTIAMTSDAKSGVTPTLNADALVAAVQGIGELADIKAETIATIGSPNLTVQMIKDLCDAAEAATCDGIVVTQGTDTLEETAFVASLFYRGNKPLVFTGAMRAATQPGADGPNNLYNSVLLAASGQVPGVSVLMNGEVHDPWHVVKEHTVSLGAFVSAHAGPIARVIEQQVRLVNPKSARMFVTFDGEKLPVALLSAGLEADTQLIQALPSLGYEGLVVEAFGAGHVSEDWADALEALLQHMPVLLASRASGGPVLENSYGYKGAEIDLIQRGLVPCGLLNSKKARLLLSLLLAENPENWKERFTAAVKAL